MSTDDSALYTGVDGEPNDGIFGNEEVNKDTEKLLQDQKQLVSELTPKLQTLIEMIDSERDIAIAFITDYVDNCQDNDVVLRGKIIGAGQYRKYLDGLKTKFVLALNETKKR